MLDSISRLGNLVKTEYIPVDSIKATNVLAIVFVSLGKDLSYQCIELEEKKEEKRYLYCKDTSGKPGLFLSWRVSSTDIINLKTAIEKKIVKEIKKFEENKIKWLAQIKDGKFRSNLKILKNFPASKENKELQRIINSYAENVDKICQEIKEKINSAIEESPEILVTVKIIKDDTEYYPGDIEDLTKLYKDYRISVR